MLAYVLDQRENDYIHYLFILSSQAKLQNELYRHTVETHNVGGLEVRM